MQGGSKMEKIDENNWKLNKNQQLRKTRKGYRIIYPIKTEGKINWKNLIIGKNIWGLVFVAIILFAIYGYIKDTAECRELIKELKEDPIGFYQKRITQVDPLRRETPNYGFNLSELKEDELNIPLSA